MTDTTTPPAMTPEQRAHFCRLLNNAGLGECANQLEADGVTIATITAERDGLIALAEDLSGGLFDANKERDAAQADLKAADAQIELLLKNHNGMSAEITRLRAVIAKDAAQMIEDQHKLHKATKALREVIDFACALNNVAAGQNPEQLDRWSAALSEIGGV